MLLRTLYKLPIFPFRGQRGATLQNGFVSARKDSLCPYVGTYYFIYYAVFHDYYFYYPFLVRLVRYRGKPHAHTDLPSVACRLAR